MMSTEERNKYEEYKNIFLNDKIQSGEIGSSSGNYQRLFKIASEEERNLNKDLMHFDFDDLENLIMKFEPKNRNSAEVYGRILSSYINYWLAKGKIKVNPLAKLKPRDFEKYVVGERLYTEKEIRRIEDACDNYQDSAIIRLIFLGVGGKKLSEIRYLKKDDIDFKQGIVKLTNVLKEDEEGNPVKKTERLAKIDDYALSLLDGAIKQEIYVKANMNLDAHPNVRPFTDLVQNEFVFRPSNTGASHNNPLDIFGIYRRIASVGKMYGLEDFTTKIIQKSGMLYYAKELSDGREIDTDDLKMVAHRFLFKTYNNMRSWLTKETLERTYKKE